MAWTFDYAELASERSLVLGWIEDERASGVEFEIAARVHRWLELPTAAATLFARAATEAEQYLSDLPAPLARHGGLLHLAGDVQGARESFTRARSLFDPVRDRSGIEAVSYLLGDDDEALLVGSGDDVGAQLAAARRDRDPGPIGGIAKSFAKRIRSRRVTLSDAQIASVLADYDWLEECFRLEASLTGDPVPTHRAMLERAGLLSSGKRVEEAEPSLPMGRWEIGETALVSPAVGRVKITLDRGRRLVLEIEGESPSYGVALYEDDAMLEGVSPVANYTEAAVDILRACAPEFEPAFGALLAAARA